MIKITVEDKLTPELNQLHNAFQGPAKTAATKVMGDAVQITIVEHLRMLNESRHDTANRLGATPSGFIGTAVNAAEAAAINPDADGVTLTLRHPVIARAFRDITIVPKTAKALTIPINAIAYNRRAGQFEGLFRLGGRGAEGARNILAIKNGDTVIPLFLLVRSVTQKQDRSLMPSDNDMSSTAAVALKKHLEKELAAFKHTLS